MKKKIGIVIVARLGSRRLPKKHLLQVSNKSMIEHLFERVKQVNFIDKIILATTNLKIDEELVNLAIKNNIHVYRGDNKNVLRRVLMCSKKFLLQKICLITADCPIIDPKLIQEIVYISKKNDKLDYINNGLMGLPNGMGSQIISIEALEKSFLSIRKKDETEHVTLNIRRNNKKFRSLYVKTKKENFFPKLSITLDEYDDYLLIKKIIEYFYKSKNFNFSCNDINNLLENKKSWLLLNKNIKRIDNKIKFSY